MACEGEERGNITSVISSNFCVQKHVHLTIVRKLIGVADGNFVAMDHDGNIVFKVIEKMFSMHDRHILVDACGNSIVTFKRKKLSAHKRWQAFRGESSNSADLIFSTKKSSIVQFRTELDVFLSGNDEEDSWDFKVEGSWLKRSCTIYDKDLKPIAMVQKKHTIGSIMLGKDTFDVIVYPQVDYAFIVALVVILYEINKDD